MAARVAQPDVHRPLAQATAIEAADAGTSAPLSSSLSAGARGTYFVSADHRLWFWGGQRRQVGADSDWARFLSAGDGGCGLKLDGSLWCLDWSAGPVLTRISPDSDWVELGGGENSGTLCGLRANGSLWCWKSLPTPGADFSDVPVELDASRTWRAFRVGDQQVCALSSVNQLWCWAHAAMLHTSNGAPGDFTALSTRDASCAVRPDGSEWCWTLADLQAAGGALTGAPAAPHDWKSVARAGQSYCGLHRDGSLACWGANFNGTLGDGTGVASATPVSIAAGQTWQSLSGAGNHFCAVGADGAPWCWGDNLFGQLGQGGLPVHAIGFTEVAPGRTWATVAAGRQHTWAIGADGSLWFWGSLDGWAFTTRPVQLGGALDWAQVATDDGEAWLLKTDGTLWSSTYPALPAQLGTAHWLRVDTSRNHTCGVQGGGTLWCWGSNESGQLGNGTVGGVQPSPTQVGTGSDWADVVVGPSHTCALHLDGALDCWGDPTGAATPVTTATRQRDTWSKVCAAAGRTCGLRPDGTAECWSDLAGTVISTASGVVDLACGDGTSCTISTAGVSSCAGSLITDWAMFSVGEQHFCGIRGNGVLGCLGESYAGATGDGSRFSNVPLPVP
ncbi:MAG: hypothetical protein IPJ65_21955 [Archangiaceae bacterium]|nr:hypothetical protein [Archangiaceae bacterium]